MLTSLVSLYQGNAKKSEKLMNIVNINQKKIWYRLSNLRNFNEIFREDVTDGKIKSQIDTPSF